MTRQRVYELGLFTATSSLLIGSVHPKAQAILAVLALILLVWWYFKKALTGWRLGVPLVFAFGWSSLQLVAIPRSFLERISPETAVIWGASADYLREDFVSAPLSLDPGATSAALLKLSVYLFVYSAAAKIREEFGARANLAIVAGTAIVVLLVTAVHGVLGLHRVYGIYEPSFAPDRWGTGPLLNGNNLAGLCVLGIFSLLGIRASRVRSTGASWTLAGAALLALGVLISGSRGGAGSLVIALVIGTLWNAPERGWRSYSPMKLLGITGVLVAIIALAGVVRSGVWTLLFGRDLDKLRVIAESLKFSSKFPWFGIGRGAFESVFQSNRLGLGETVFAYPENFIAQWWCEWGGPATLLLLGYMAFKALQKIRFALRGRAERWIFLGTLALLLHNLVDLSTEVPGVVIPWLCLVAALPPLGRRAKSSVGGWLVPVVVFGAIGASLGIVGAKGGLHPVSDARILARKALNTCASEACVAEIRTISRRFPSEPYFPRAAGLAEIGRRSSPLRDLNHALRLGPRSGRTHLAVAVWLAPRVRHQALLEVRNAVTLDPTLLTEGAEIAASSSLVLDELVRSAPSTPFEAEYLFRLSATPRVQTARDVRKHLLERALAKNPRHLNAGLDYAQLLLEQSKAGTCSECIDQARNVLGKLEAPVRSSSLVRVQAQLIALSEGPEASLTWVERECMLLSAEAATCLLIAVEVAHELGPTRFRAASDSLLRMACISSEGCLDAYERLGDVCIRYGETENAIQFKKRGAELAGDPDRWLELAKLCAKSGQLECASEATSEAERLSGIGHNSSQEHE